MTDFNKPPPEPTPDPRGGPENPDPFGNTPDPRQPPPNAWGGPPHPNPYGGDPNPNPWGGPVVKKTPDTAIAALILGIAGLVMCPLVCSIPAIVLGKQAMDQVDGQPQAFSGRGIAQTGYVLGIVGTALTVLAIVVVGIAVLIAL